MLLEHSLSFGKYMKKRLSILILILMSFPAGANAIETIRISSTGDGGIKNVTSASAFGEDGNDARAEVHVRNIVDGQGSTEVRVETYVDGVRETREVRKHIIGTGTVKIRIATSTEKDGLEEMEVAPSGEMAYTGTSSAVRESREIAGGIVSFLRNMLRALSSFWLF